MNPMHSVTNIFPSLHWLQEAYRPRRYHYVPCNSCINGFPEPILVFWVVSILCVIYFDFHFILLLFVHLYKAPRILLEISLV